MNIINFIRNHLLIYRISMIASVILIANFTKYFHAVLLWILLLIVIGKLYEAFILRGGHRWDSDPVSLNLMVVSKFAEYVWNGFR